MKEADLLIGLFYFVQLSVSEPGRGEQDIVPGKVRDPRKAQAKRHLAEYSEKNTRRREAGLIFCAKN
jgi:hypothetical protein